MASLETFPQAIAFTISGVLETDQSIGGWTILPLPGVATVLGTRKAVKVAGTIDDEPFAATILPWNDGVQMIPVKAPLRKKIGKQAGDTVTVHLTERFS